MLFEALPARVLRGTQATFSQALSMASTCSLATTVTCQHFILGPRHNITHSVCVRSICRHGSCLLACVCELFPMRLSFLCGQKVSACHRLATSLSPQLESRLPPQL